MQITAVCMPTGISKVAAHPVRSPWWGPGPGKQSAAVSGDGAGLRMD